MAKNVLKKVKFKANNATAILVPFASGVNGLTGLNANGGQGKDRELEVKSVSKMKEFKQKNVHCLQFIANGANGVAGASVQKVAALELNRGFEV